MPTPVRASAETMPLVTVWPTPNGSPMASTRSPTWASSRVVERQHRQLLGPDVDLQHRHVGARVGQQHLGRELAAVAEHDHDLLAARR